MGLSLTAALERVLHREDFAWVGGAAEGLPEEHSVVSGLMWCVEGLHRVNGERKKRERERERVRVGVRVGVRARYTRKKVKLYIYMEDMQAIGLEGISLLSLTSTGHISGLDR